MKHEITVGQTSLSFVTETSSCSLKLPGFQMNDLIPILRLNGTDVVVKDWFIVSASGRSVAAKGVSDEAEMEWTAAIPCDGKVVFSLNIKLNKECDDIEFYYFADQTVSGSHLLNQTGTVGGIVLKEGTDQSFTGGLFLALTANDMQLCFSYPVQCDHEPVFFGHADNGCINKFQTGSRIRFYSGKEIKPEPLTIRSGNGFQILDVYADENRTDKKEIPQEPAGWNSWDYYRWTITEEEALANAEFIAKDPVLSKYVKKFTIDDGWQYAYGEWNANPYFPHGMKYQADELKKLGFEPGLWICPMILEPHSMKAQLDGDLCFLSEEGFPCEGFNCMNRIGMVLDPTIKQVQDYIEQTIRRYADMGYMHFKLDFLASVMHAKRSVNPSVPRGHYIRDIIAAARRGAAGRARILGCGFPLIGGDIVDSCRVSGDIHARWSSIKNNERQISAHYWMNNKLFRNDPDFALCRSFDTCEDPDINRLQACSILVKQTPAQDNKALASYQQVDIHRPQSEILLSLVIVSGGIVNLSDKMMLLNESGLELARRTVSAPIGETGVPLDLFLNENPRCWLQKVGNAHRVLMINWNDEEQELALDLDALGITAWKAVNFWNDKAIKITNGKISEIVPPRSCVFAEVQ